MTAPIRSMPAFEPYRVILDYEALQDGFLDRIEDLNTTFTQIDDVGGMTRGNTQRLLTKNEGTKRKDRPSSSSKRTFGWESLAKELKATGLALVLVVDDERFAPLKAELMQRKRPRKLPNGSIKRPTWLFTRSKSIKMQVLRNQTLSPAQRKKIAKRAAKARWAKRRKSALQSPAPEFGKNGVAIVLNGNIQRPMANQLPGNAGETCDLGL